MEQSRSLSPTQARLKERQRLLSSAQRRLPLHLPLPPLQQIVPLRTSTGSRSSNGWRMLSKVLPPPSPIEKTDSTCHPEIPSFVDSSLAVFANQGIHSVADLCRGEDLGVKGLKQIGLATPAAWALHSAMKVASLSLQTASALPNHSQRSVAIAETSQRKVWGYALQDDTSSSESEEGESEHRAVSEDQQKAKISDSAEKAPAQSCSSWRNFVTIGSSSSSDEEEEAGRERDARAERTVS
jgi:hypothetical protein